MSSGITNYGGRYNFRKPYKPLTEMSLEELRTLKEEWWSQAETSGLKDDCQRVADNGLADKYTNSIFSVHSSDEAGYDLTVSVNGQLVFSNHSNLCLPGEWCRKIRSLLEEFDQSNRSALISELTLVKDWKM